MPRRRRDPFRKAQIAPRITVPKPEPVVEPEPDHRCCALDEGHEGPCEWVCSDCQGSGECSACGGSGDDGSGLDYTCMECGGGDCPYCYGGMCTGEVC